VVLLLAWGAASHSGTLSTYPPQPESRVQPGEVLDTARVALFSGHADQAYRLLMTAQPEMAGDPEWLDLAARVYLALDRPLRMAECLLPAAETRDPEALSRVKAILSRQGPHPPRSFASIPNGKWPGFDRTSLKDVESLAPGPDGSVYLLTREALIHVGADGTRLTVSPLRDGTDLTLDVAGTPIALSAVGVLWGDRLVPLPAGANKPVSVAASPEGSLFVLDRGARRLYRLSAEGALTGSINVPLDEPFRVRLDMAGRIYIADRDTGRVHLYGPDMVPIRILDPAATGHEVRRIDDMMVDFAGDVLLLDGRAHDLLLFGSDGRYLGTTAGRFPRVDAAGWDGLSRLVFVSWREGVLGRAST
jgi:hypothetical protein